MDKKVIGIAAAALIGGAGAASASVMSPTSYADLLQPIPNASEILKSIDSQPPPIEKAQFFFGFGDHHHHNWHHHHHHHGWGWGHHHHHHHHWGHHHHNWHHHHH